MKSKIIALTLATMVAMGLVIYSAIMMISGSSDITSILQRMSPALILWRLCLYAGLIWLYLYKRKRELARSDDQREKIKAIDKAVYCGLAVCATVEFSLAI